ncbi:MULTISPECIES: hypothetical protein [Caldilinea]|jgi:hypothetical protein|uniref:hypothetical protein n=1 Tax=Caldilinea TaxID=233191 RepID=UPI0005C5E920|nr:MULTISPECIES: hypothetical protein [Caldilinea]MBO9391391.1 hypothetical protein [Caldilinea sp.]GIV75014.1 MAG: hypothetical protein KatS3mg049_3570 [Caldilinea sp.]
MRREVLVEEPVHALVRVMTDGSVLPTSFVWRDRTRYVATVGRQWEERVQGKLIRCYLIQSVDDNTFELHWDPGENQWTLHRAWLRDLAV